MDVPIHRPIQRNTLARFDTRKPIAPRPLLIQAQHALVVRARPGAAVGVCGVENPAQLAGVALEELAFVGDFALAGTVGDRGGVGGEC